MPGISARSVNSEEAMCPQLCLSNTDEASQMSRYCEMLLMYVGGRPDWAKNIVVMAVNGLAEWVVP